MFLILFPLCFMAGLIQTVTGFGSGVVIMLVLPLLMPLIEASTISNSITLFLCTSLAWQYRKTINFKTYYVSAYNFLYSEWNYIKTGAIYELFNT